MAEKTERGGLSRLRQRVPNSLACELRTLADFFSRKPQALYVGWVGHGNLGDDILYQAHQQLFRGITLSVYRKSRVLKPLCRITAGGPYRFGILGGGTLINQSHQWLNAVRHLQEMGVPMICLGTGVASRTFWREGGKDVRGLGHDQNEWEEWLRVLRKFRFVGVRGPDSAAALTDGGLQGVQVVGDTALSLCGGPPRAGRWRAKVLGVCVGVKEMDPIWGDPARYRDGVVEFIRSMCASGYEVHLLPICRRDVPSNEFVLERVGLETCTMRIAFDTYADYAAATRECEVFVGQKLHSTVIACMNVTPSVMIEYRPKCRDFMASLGLERHVIRTDEFTAQSGVRAVRQLLDEREVVEQALTSHIAEFVKTQADAVRMLLDDSGSLRSPSAG